MLDVVIPHNGHGTPVRNLDGQTGADMFTKSGTVINSPAFSLGALMKKEAPMTYIRAISTVTSAYCLRIESRPDLPELFLISYLITTNLRINRRRAWQCALQAQITKEGAFPCAPTVKIDSHAAFFCNLKRDSSIWTNLLHFETERPAVVVREDQLVV